MRLEYYQLQGLYYYHRYHQPNPLTVQRSYIHRRRHQLMRLLSKKLNCCQDCHLHLLQQFF